MIMNKIKIRIKDNVDICVRYITGYENIHNYRDF